MECGYCVKPIVGQGLRKPASVQCFYMKSEPLS